MKILHKGVMPETYLFTTTCFRCKTEFEFERREAKFTDDQRDGAFLTIACPTCGQSCHASVKTGRPPTITT